MFSCDYNGWADVPEEEREGLDAFEARGAPSPVAAGTPSAGRSTQVLPVRWQQAGRREPGAERRAA